MVPVQQYDYPPGPRLVENAIDAAQPLSEPALEVSCQRVTVHFSD